MADVLVFGSNKQGIHGSGAAKTARDVFGAQIGVGSGRTGNAYGIPTKKTPTHDIRQLPLAEIQESVWDFLDYANVTTDDRFLITRVGCGLAGYTDKEIAPMFTKDRNDNPPPDNCYFDTIWTWLFSGLKSWKR